MNRIADLPDTIKLRLRDTSLLKILANMSWLMGEQILRMVSSLFVGIAVTRYLGPERYGTFSHATALVAIFGFLATLGLQAIVHRDMVRDPSRWAETMGTAFALRLAGGLMTFILAVGVAIQTQPLDPVFRWLVAVMALGTLLQAFDVIDYWFQSQVASKYVVIAKSIALATASVLKIVLVLVHAPLLAFAVAASLEILLTSLGFAVAYRVSGFNLWEWRFSIRRAKSLLQESWPFILSSLFVTVRMRIDQIMLGGMVGHKELGIYMAATRLSELCYLVPITIVASVAPSIIAAKQADQARYQGYLKKLFKGMVLLAFLAALPMAIFSGWIVTLFYEQEYAAAGRVLSIHAWAALFIFMGVAQGPWEVAEGLQGWNSARAAIGALVNIGMNLLLIPRYGAVGAAVAAVSACLAADYLANSLYPKSRHVFRIQTRALFWIR